MASSYQRCILLNKVTAKIKKPLSFRQWYVVSLVTLSTFDALSDYIPSKKSRIKSRRTRERLQFYEIFMLPGAAYQPCRAASTGPPSKTCIAPFFNDILGLLHKHHLTSTIKVFSLSANAFLAASFVLTKLFPF